MTASTALVLAAEQTEFTSEQLAALEQLGVKGVPGAELKIYFHQCARTGLDPFLKQVYLIGRYSTALQKKVYTIQTGIDGYRLIAERSGKYVGSESQVHMAGNLPISATVTVRKLVGGVIGEFTATALYKEYVQMKDGEPSGLWKTMPVSQLIKCAEALALRKGFPQDLFGIYSTEEMSQADSTIEAEAIEVDSLVSSDNIEKFKALCAKLGFAWEKIFELAEAQPEGLRESQLPTLNEAINVAKITPADYALDATEAVGTDAQVREIAAKLKEHPAQTVTGPDGEVYAVIPKAATPPVEGVDPITKGQTNMLGSLCRGQGWNDTQRHEQASTFTGRAIKSFTELTKSEAGKFIDHVKALGAGE